MAPDVVAKTPVALRDHELISVGMSDRVHLSLEHDPTVEIISVSVVIEGGLVHPFPAEAGIPHLWEHLIARHGNFLSRPIARALTSVGAVIQASTHPFHTEYHVALPRDATDDIVGYLAQLVTYWCSIGRQRFHPVAVEEEMSSISRELDERLLGGIARLFPWTEVFNALLPGRDANDNLLLNALGDGGDAARALGMFARRALASRTAISVVGPVHGEDLLPSLAAEGFSQTFPGNDFFRRGSAVRFSAPRSLLRTVPGLRTPLHASANPLGERGASSSAAQALAAVTAEALDRQGTTARWQVGAFGPFGGPDTEILIYAGGRPFDPTTEPAAIGAAAIERAKARALAILRRTQAAASARARQRAIGILFGTSVEEISGAIEKTSAKDVHDVFSTMGDRRVGRLSWLPEPE